MKGNILLIVIVSIINTLFVSAQTSKTVNYYSGGETIEAPLHNNYFLVYFDMETITEEQISNNFEIVSIENLENDHICCMLNVPNNNYDSVVNHFREMTCVTDVEPVIGGGSPVGVSNKFYVRLKNCNDVQLLETFAKQTMTKLLYQVPYCENWYALETNKNSFGNSIDVANLFWETGLFAAIDPGFIHHFTSQDYCVSDSIFSDQWGMTAVKACDAWNITTGSNQTKVAVVDKGVDVNHRELSHVNVAFSYDVMNLSSPAQLYSSQETDEFNNLYVVYHGTLVGGVILSNHNANRVAGLSPNASLINISHPLTHAGDSSGEKFAIAINQAVNHGARIINNSWGASNRNEFTRADLIESAIDNAILHDCIVVFSAGNSNTGPGMFYPSEYRPEILTVGAIKSNLLRWEYSTYGTHLDVVAPGEFIWSTNAYNQYYRSNGTSLAAPHVSGTAALMLSVNPNLSAQNVRDIIEQTAQKVGGYSYQPTPNRPNGTWHQQMGYGLLDAHKAVLTAAYYQIYGDDEISLCDNTSYTVINQYNQSVSDVSFLWTCSDNIRIVSGESTGSVTVKGVDFGNGWLSCRVIHAGDTVSSTIDIQVVENVETVYKDVTLTSGMSFPSTFTIGGTVDIASGTTITWTGKNVHFTKFARLIVRPGGKLVVDGGTLTSACDDVMWQGIEVVGDRTKRQVEPYQGKLELKNGAILENAMCGIYTGLHSDTVNYATTGGIISAENTTFRNNRQSVVINSYAYTAPSGGIANYNATFSRCTFTVDNNNLFAANNTGFAEHARLWDVKGVKFKGCSFSNSTNNLYWNGRGIYADDAGVYVETYCPRQLYYTECECPESIAVYSSFSGFTTAVEVNTTGNPYSVRIDETSFNNNGTGVRINGNDYATVTRNTFNLDSWPSHSGGNVGLYLNTCTGYLVDDNVFERTTYPSGQLILDNSTGICVAGSGISPNSIHYNHFNNLTKGISVVGTNGHHKWSGLQMTCNDFSGGKHDIYLNNGATVSYVQGSSTKGADNMFSNVTYNTTNFHNPNAIPPISYYYSNSYSNLDPAHYSNLTKTSIKEEYDCSSTLCDNGIPGGGGSGGQYLAGFQSDVNAYTTSLANQSPTDGTDGGVDETLSETVRALSETYYNAVRALMADSVLDLNTLEQWHTAAQPIGDPYSLTETRFMMGYSEPFVADADDAELANYAEFHAMKLALRGQYDNTDNQDNNNINLSNSLNSPTINWYALTPAQIAQLQTIAERNTGRASVMAKGVLCFFFGICYDDELLVDDNADSQDNDGDAETRSAKAVQQVGEASLNVYPNPTDDILYVELSGAGIQSAGLYDLQGRVVADAANAGGHPAVTFNVRNVPAGVYVLRVTDENGKEYHQKVVVK